MKNACLLPWACALLIVTSTSASTQAATNLTVDETGVLAITSGDGQPVTALPSGSVSEKIQADNQSFKVSFGKDLRGNSTLIVYPNPENPQALDLNIFSKPVQMTPDAVLTITGGGDSAQAVFQAGVLGTVTVDGNELPAGGSTALNQAPVAPRTPPEPATSDEEVFTAIAGQPKGTEGKGSTGNGGTVGGNVPAGDRFGLTPPRDRQSIVGGELIIAGSSDSYKRQSAGGTATPEGGYTGLIVREVEGDVMYSKSGADPMEMLRNGVEAPRLKAGDVVPPGAQIRTGPNSKVIATPFPGVAIQLQQNTSFGVPLSTLVKENGSSKRKFEGYLTKGGVLSAIKGIPPEDIDFKIRTPQGIAAARGTVYAVYSDGTRTLVVTDDGVVTAYTPDGIITIDVRTGKKVILSFQPNGEITYEEFDADAEELALLENFLNEVQQYLDDQGLPDEGFFVIDLPGNPFNDLVNTLDPVLNPEDITPTTP